MFGNPTRGGVASEVGVIGVGAAFKSARGLDQIFGVHVTHVGVTTGFCNFARDFNVACVNPHGVPVDQQSVARLQQDIVGRITGKCLAKIYAEDFGCSVGINTERPERCRKHSTSARRQEKRRRARTIVREFYKYRVSGLHR